MNNEQEFEYLNGTQKPPKQKKNIFLNICVAVAWILYIILYFVCGFITFFAIILFGISIRPKKHRKRWF